MAQILLAWIVGLQDDAETTRLIHALGDESAAVRDSAQRRLAFQGSKVKPALEAAVPESQDAEIRERAKQALALIGVMEGRTEPEIAVALPFLTEGCDEQRKVASWAIQRQIRKPEPNEKPDFDPVAVRKALCQAAKDRLENVRRFSMEALGKLEDPEALSTMIQGLADADVCDIACQAIAALGPRASGASEALTKLARASDMNTLGFACEALSAVLEDKSIPILFEVLKGRSLSTYERYRIGYAFDARTMTPEIKEFMERELESDVAHARVRAAQYLATRGDIETARFLQRYVKDSDPDLRECAVSAAGQWKLEESVDEIARIVQNDPSLDVRKAAAVSLGKIGGAKAIQSLVKELHQDQLSGEAGRALARMDGDDSYQALYDGLFERGADVCQGVWSGLTSDRHIRLFLSFHEKRPTPVAAAVIHGMLFRAEDRGSIVDESELEGLKIDPEIIARVKKSAGKDYDVKRTLFLHRLGLVFCNFAFRRNVGPNELDCLPRMGVRVLYQKTDKGWKQIGIEGKLED